MFVVNSPSGGGIQSTAALPPSFIDGALLPVIGSVSTGAGRLT